MKQFYFLLAFIIFGQLGLMAQVKKKSLVENNHSFTSVDSNFIKKLFIQTNKIRPESKDSLITEGKNIFHLSKKINWTYGMAVSSERIGRIYWSLGQYDSALFYHYISLKEFKKINLWKDYWDVVVMIGQDYANSTKYDEALVYLNAALHEYQFRKEEGGVVYVLGILGWVYSNKGDYATYSQLLYQKLKNELIRKDSFLLLRANFDLAVNNLDLNKIIEAEKILMDWWPFIKKQNPYFLNLEYTTLKIRIAKSQNQVDSLLYYLQQEKVIGHQNNDKYWVADAFANFGNYYTSINKNKIGLYHYDSAYYYFKLSNQTKELVSVNCSKAKCYLKLGNTKAASLAMKEASELIKKFNSKGSNLEYYEAKYLVDSALSNWTSAFKYLQFYHELSKQIYNQTNTQQILELQIRLESDKRETLLKEKNKVIFLGFIGLAIVTLSILAFSIILYFKNKRVKKLNEIQRTMLHEIHHRVKNNLQLISGFIQLQLNKTDDAKGRDALEESINNIQVVSLVHENLYSQASDLVNLNNYIQGLCIGIRSILKTMIHPEIKVQCDEILLNIDQSIPVGLIINELITNSIKHAFKGKENQKLEIVINISTKNQIVQISYSDNGTGFNLDNVNKTSIGLKLLKMLVQELHGTYKMNGQNGCYFELNFRNKTK
jgi:two-component sensor histidine kinase